MRIPRQACLMSNGLRVLAIGLTLVLAVEWSQPILVLAQPNGTQAGAVSSADELPPIQEAETVEVRSPFYKRWWFWTIVAVVVGGAAIAVAAGGGGGSNGSSPTTVTVNGPAPH
jgi:hypothetical protein